MKITSLAGLAKEAEEKSCTIGAVVRELQKEKDGVDPYEKMAEVWQTMKRCVKDALEHPMPSRGGMLGGGGAKLYAYSWQNPSYCGAELLQAVAMALAVAESNAAMGLVVAAPTAGAAGILPGVLSMIQNSRNLTDEMIVDALFAASGIGMVIAKRATLAGAEGGCQAECGSAAAMAAGAAAQLAGASPETVCHAVALSLKNQLGLVCDPVCGLVEVPCAKRNALSASHALTAADLALAGIQSFIPADEVIDAMGKIGKALPEALRETAAGGLAATPTARAYAKTH